MIQVYHNPRCSKSRECLLFFENSGAEFEVIHYLNDTPTAQELKILIQKLGIKPIELIRQKEAIWVSKYKDRKMTPSLVIKAMVSHPILIERPIVINGDKAVIARPKEKAAAII